MTYPITPTGATLDDFGLLTVPTWVKRYHWRGKDGEKATTISPEIKGKAWDLIDGSLEVPDILRITESSQMGAYSHTLIRQHCEEFHKYLAFLYKLVAGLDFGFWKGTILYGGASTNWADFITVWGNTEGKELTISNTYPGCEDPRGFDKMLTVPDPVWVENPSEGTSGRYSIHPGMPVVDSVGSVAWIKEGIQYGEITTVCQLTHTLKQGTGEFTLWDTFGEPESHEYINPGKWLWSARKDQTHPYTGSENWCELTGLSGESGAIAYPILYGESGSYIGTFKVIATHSGGSTTDETAYYLDGFPGADAKVKIVYASGSFKSYINLDKVDATITSYTVSFCPEVDPLTHTDHTDIDMRTMIGCAHLIKDMGKSLGSAASYVNWVCVDPQGNHFYCDQHDLGADVSQLNDKCCNTCCPNFDFIGKDRGVNDTIHGGWIPTHRFWRDIFLAHNIYLCRVAADSGSSYASRGTGGFPSIWWLTGATRNFDFGGLFVPEIQLKNTGLIGYLDTSTTPFYTLVKGMDAVTKAFDNGATENGDMAGGDIHDSTGMHDQYKTMPGIKGLCHKPIYPLSPSRGFSGLYQRVTRKRITFQDIDINDAKIDTPQEFRDGTVYVRSGNVLEVRLSRGTYVVPGDGIQAAAKYIDAATKLTDNVVALHMQPGIEFAYVFLGVGNIQLLPYVVAGQTVDPPDNRRDWNYGASDKASEQGFTDKVRKGMSLRIVGAPTIDGHDLSTISMTVIAAQAFKGPAFEREVPGTAGTVTQEFVTGAAFFPHLYDSQGNDVQVNTYTPQYVKYGFKGGTQYSGIQNMLYGTEYPTPDDTIYDAHFRLGGRPNISGHTIPALNGSSNNGYLYALLAYSISHNLSDLQFTVGYTIPGDETVYEKVVNMYSLNTVGGIGFYSVPCIPLTGQPDLSEGVDLTLEWYNEHTRAWESPIQTFDGIKVCTDESPYEWSPPDYNKWHIFKRLNTFYAAFPTNLWGLKLRLTYTRTGGALSITLDHPNTSEIQKGHPADLEDYRLLMDEVVVEDDTGLVVDWLTGLNPIPQENYRIELIDGVTPAILPPANKRTYNGSIVPTNYPIELYHMETFEGVEVAITPTILSRHDGRLFIDIATWSKALKQYLYIKTSFLESISAVSSYMLTDIRKCFQVLNAFGADVEGSSMRLTARHFVVRSGSGSKYTYGPYWRRPVVAGQYGLSDLEDEPIDGVVTPVFGTDDQPDGLAPTSIGTLWFGVYWTSTVKSFIPSKGLMEYSGIIDKAYLALEIVDATVSHHYDSSPQTPPDDTTEDIVSTDIKLVAISLEPFDSLSGIDYYKVSVLGGLGSVVDGTWVDTVEDGHKVYRCMVDITDTMVALHSLPQNPNATYRIGVVGSGSPLPGSSDFRAIMESLWDTFSITIDENGVLTDRELAFRSYSLPTVLFKNVFVVIKEDELQKLTPEVVPGLYPALV